MNNQPYTPHNQMASAPPLSPSIYPNNDYVPATVNQNSTEKSSESYTPNIQPIYPSGTIQPPPYQPPTTGPYQPNSYPVNPYPSNTPYTPTNYPSNPYPTPYPSNTPYPPSYTPGTSNSYKPYPNTPGVYPSTVPTQTTYIVPNAFDSGARFGPNCPAVVPPPPPGCPPNLVQMAVSNGQNVVIGQKKPNWFTGGSGGGTSFW